MTIKVIKTKEDYFEALSRFEQIFQAKDGSSEEEEADILAILIEDYEQKKFSIEAPHPLDAIKFRMEEQGLSNKDLANILGHKSRVTDIFRKNRKLNLQMIRRLHTALNIPLETLIKDYE